MCVYLFKAHLCQTRSETPKTGFLASRLIYCMLNCMVAMKYVLKLSFIAKMKSDKASYYLIIYQNLVSVHFMAQFDSAWIPTFIFAFTWINNLLLPSTFSLTFAVFYQCSNDSCCFFFPCVKIQSLLSISS